MANNLIFEEKTHTYTENGEQLISVTQLLKKHNIGVNYDSVNEFVLEQAKKRGKAIHSQVEYILKENDYEDAKPEAIQIANEIKKLDNYEIKSEFQLVSHNSILPYAGTIDILAVEKGKGKKKKGTIYDIKTSKSWTKDQEIGAKWQVSLYGYALKEQNIEIEKYIILRFTNEKERTLIQTELNPMKETEIEELLTCEKNGVPFYQDSILSIEELNSKAIALFKSLKIQKDRVKQLQAETKDIENKIYDFMKENDIYSALSFDNSIEIVRTRDAIVNSIDTERLKTEMPNVYKTFLKEIVRKGTLKINILNNNDLGDIQYD